MTSFISQLGWTDEDDIVLMESVVLDKEIPEIFHSKWLNSLNEQNNNNTDTFLDFIWRRKIILKKLTSRFRMGSKNPSILRIFTTDDTKTEHQYQRADFTEQKIDTLRGYYHKLKSDETTNEKTIITVPTIKEKGTKRKKSTPKSPQSNQASSSRTCLDEQNLLGSTKAITIKFTGDGSLSSDPSFLIRSENNDGKTWVNGVKLFVMASTSKLAPLVFQDPEDFNHFANLLKEDLGEPLEDFLSLNNSILTCIKDTCEVMDKNLARKHNRIAISNQSFSNNTIQMTHDTNEVSLTLKLTGKTLVSELKKIVNDFIQESNLENEEEFQEDLEYDTDSKSDAGQIVFHVVIEPRNETSCVNCSYEVQTSESITNYMQSIRSDGNVRQNIIDQAKRYLQLPSSSLEDSHLSNVEAGEGRSIRVTFEATLPKDSELVKAFNLQNHGSHKVYFEQRVIANELFKRTRNLIGEDRFSQFDKLEFLVCSPNQNTLYEQNMKRLNDARSGILFGPIEQVAVKYYKKHIRVFEEFKDRAKNNKNTFHVIVADECHFAITKGNAHDTFVNDWQHAGTDSWAMGMDNIFVLQISATPYNILSKDSIIPERYELKENLEAFNTTKNRAEVILCGHVIRVVDDKYSSSRSPCIIHPLQQVSPKYGAKIEASDLQYLGDVFSIRSSRLPDHFGDLKAQDLVFATKVNDAYEIHPIDITDESKTITISTREFNLKLQKSNDVFRLTQDIQCPLNINLESFTIDPQAQSPQQLRKGEVVQVYRRVKWAVKFVVECSGDNDEYEVDDLELRLVTGCCSEENIVTWDKAQKANDHSNDIMRDHDEKFDMMYRSKSFYISTMKSNRPLIRQDTFFNSLIRECKTVAGILRPLLLAVDYYFSILYYSYVHSKITPTTKDVLTQFLLVDDFVSNSDQKTCVQACKYFYLSRILEQFAQRHSITDTSIVRILKEKRSLLKPSGSGRDEDDDDYVPPSEKKRVIKKETNKKKENSNIDLDEQSKTNETKKPKRKSKKDKEADDLVEMLQRYIDDVHSIIDEQSKTDDSEMCSLFNKLLEGKKNMSPTDIHPEIPRDYCFTETDAVVRDLFDSCQVKGDKLKGKMKIIRVTSTPYATSFQEVLMGAIQIVTKYNEGSTVQKYPEVLKDTGKDYLTLDQLSAAYQNAMAERLLHKDIFSQWCRKRIAKEHKRLTYEQLLDLPCFLILVQKGRQGDTFPRSFDLLDMRSKGESLPNLSSFTQEIGRMCRYATDEEPLPEAIVPASYYRELKKTSESSVLFRANTSMNLDKYLTKRGTQQPQDYWDMVTYCRRITKAVEGKVQNNKKDNKNTGEGGSSTVASFDFGRSPNANPAGKVVHRNRLLLYAEPQIGKTDAFIHYLQLLQDFFFESHPLDIPEQPYEDINMEDCIPSRMEDCLLPYHDYVLSTTSRKICEYSRLTPGKYGKRLFERREEAMKKAQEFGGMKKSKFAEMIYQLECSLLSSQTHREQLHKFLQSTAEVRKDYLTYDGRFIDLYNEMFNRNRSSMKIEKGVLASSQQTIAIQQEVTKNAVSGNEQPEATDSSTNSSDNNFINKGLARLSRDGPILYRDVPKQVGLSERLKQSLVHLGFSADCLPQFSIPKSQSNKFTFDQMGLVDGICHEISSNGKSDTIRYWIFMPSFQRAISGLFSLEAIEENCSYGQIIVVQPGEEFESYVEMLGHHHIIMSLPEKIDLRKLYENIWDGTTDIIDNYCSYTYEATATTGKIGFSRLSIQLMAHVLALPFIWMMDDQVTYFEEIDFENDRQRKRCPMNRVLGSLERIVSDHVPLNTLLQDNKNMESFLTTKNGTDKKVKYMSSIELAETDEAQEHTGGANQYAIIGIRKDGYRYSNKAYYRPFLASHAVCSVFLLNVRATIEKRALFPAREYQEDIEFAYVCEERNLICLKSQRYFLSKTVNRLRVRELDPIQQPLLLYSYTLENIKNATNRIKNSPPHEITPDESEQFKAIVSQYRSDGMKVTNDCKALDEEFDNGVCALNLSHIRNLENDYWSVLELSSRFLKMFKNKDRKCEYFSPQKEEANICEIIVTVNLVEEDSKISGNNKRTRDDDQLNLDDSVLQQTKVQKVD